VTRRLDLRSSADRRDALTRRRLDEIVPKLMDGAGIDCWILSSREYADDPVVMTMLPATWMSSRRRTILVFFRTSGSVERFAVSRYEVDGLFPTVWDVDKQPDQWSALADLVRDRDPRRMALSMSGDFAHGDGLTATEHGALLRALGQDLGARIVLGDDLAIGWLETRLPEERPVMAEACAIAHALLRRALSTETVKRGETTTTDLEWWLRARVQELGTDVWFQPTASVQRSEGDLRGPFSSHPGAVTIEPGDLVHIDFGIVWHGLCTDQQQHGYVLKDDESEVPEGLSTALATANRLQDILMGNFELGRSGNEVLHASLNLATYETILGKIYTHPIGLHGHGAGPTIGLWDQHDGVPGSGDRRLVADTAWSIELMVETTVPEWDNQPVRIMLEEDAWFDGENCDFFDGRQTRIWGI
jgi:Xaa-Pro aminopeptidase